MPRLNPSDRDELLIRVDERLKYTCELTEKQEGHLSTLNDRVAENALNIDRNDKRINQIERVVENGVPMRLSKKQLAASGGSLATIIASAMLIIGKSLGWW